MRFLRAFARVLLYLGGKPHPSVVIPTYLQDFLAVPTRSLTTAGPTATHAAAPPPAPSRGRTSGQFTDRLLDIKDVSAKTSISRSKLYEMMAKGLFPQSIHLAPQMVRWRESTIDAWLDTLESSAACTMH